MISLIDACNVVNDSRTVLQIVPDLPSVIYTYNHPIRRGLISFLHGSQANQYTSDERRCTENWPFSPGLGGTV